VKTKPWTLQVNNIPGLLQKARGTHNNPVIQIPEIQAGIESLNLVDNRSKGKTKKKGPQRVTLLNSTRRRDDVGVIVQKNRGRTVTPLNPVIQTWKRLVNRGKKTGAVYAIECVSKIHF
jgi:molybdate-binding protein